MSYPFSRRDLLKSMVAPGLIPLLTGLQPVSAAGRRLLRRVSLGGVSGHMTGAKALVETLILEGTECVFGIPGAQENELWDAFKSRGLGYLLVTHEFSAAAMADGYARSTGKPGVLCVVPGPGVTNSLGGIGEALLDSIPLVCIVGDVARGDKYRPFQLHELPQLGLLQQMTKGVFEVQHAADIPTAVRQAFQLAQCGEPGPVAVVIPYNLLIDTHQYDSPPLEPAGVSLDEDAFNRALCLLSDRKLRVGIYAGLGCMDHSCLLVSVAELLQAPVATSVSGKGVIPENHPLAVGWGYGPQGTRTAEQAFRSVDLVLAIGVRYSEVSTAAYSIPQHRHVIHVDANPNNLGRILKTEVCVHADAGLFLSQLLEHGDQLRRAPDEKLVAHIQAWKGEECKKNAEMVAVCGADPMAFLLALRRCTNPDALVFVDVTLVEHWAAEVFQTWLPRTYFNPTNNQAMGWSIPAALGAQRVHPGRQTVTVTGDGCLLMSGMELSTAARECLPVKFFILDDQAYGIMQALQKPAYLRTTATILARLDYPALAKAMGIEYQEITTTCDLEPCIRGALEMPGPVLTRVVTDYRKRPIRWLEAVKSHYKKELSTEQKVRFAARLGVRTLDLAPQND
ncbi:MAG TPA: thiamine pyrophosphate-binding protein [Gemmataceae bacterium]|nr:thiamine pyrophosphate-binding protein [Gemmataceae bacterium]